MAKSGRIVRYTADEIDDMLRRGEDRTDWARVDAMTEEELETAIDFDDEGEFDLSTAQAGIPGPTRPLTLWLDADVIEWFKAQDADYQARMNAVLRNFVAAQKKREPATPSSH
ncbi:MAG: BrnA antitoxin family protein [Thermomicrobiales bacterium]